MHNLKISRLISFRATIRTNTTPDIHQIEDTDLRISVTMNCKLQQFVGRRKHGYALSRLFLLMSVVRAPIGRWRDSTPAHVLEGRPARSDAMLARFGTDMPMR